MDTLLPNLALYLEVCSTSKRSLFSIKPSFSILFIFQQVEVKQLENDIGQLRGACDDMSKRVTHLTAGKGNFEFRSVFIEKLVINEWDR